MPWSPQQYKRFKDIRYQPFFDLSGMITDENLRSAVDIGCGTGEQTAILAEKFSTAHFTGIDSSKEMLLESEKLTHSRLHFHQESIEAFADSNSQWDLIFSNAALQWADRHSLLFPKLIRKLHPNGQFAVQMPVQRENVLNKMVWELVQQEPFAGFLKGWKRESPVLSIDEYAQIFFDNGLSDIQIIQKVYPILADSPDILLDFISGTTLVPYIEKLTAGQQDLFMNAFRKRIAAALPKFPAIYAFKRLLLYGVKV